MIALALPAQAAPVPAASLAGTVLDGSGAALEGVSVRLSVAGETRTAASDGEGRFTFTGLPAGPYTLTWSKPGFADATTAGTLMAGARQLAPQTLTVAAASTDVRVTLTATELATEQIHIEEKQRLLGVIPNFYVTYDPHAVPLDAAQKFQLAGKQLLDPVSFGITGAVAGIEQANDTFPAFGQGAQGFGKRYGAAYADFAIGTMLSAAILPSLLHQDPRYFYKGEGTVRERSYHAVKQSVVCKGDDRHWQFCASRIFGDLGAAGISNLYYPAADRNGAGLTFRNAAIGIGGNVIGNLVQEFVLRRFTPSAKNRPPAP